jgi:hypothetical protein
MPKTAVCLFKSPDVAEEVVRQIETVGIPRNEIQTLREPLDFGREGVTSIPEVDFEVGLVRELTRIGATQQMAEDCLEGLRHGGVLVIATGPDEKVDRASEIMNRNGGADTEETSGPETHWPDSVGEGVAAAAGGQVQAGRERQASSGAAFFVW